MRLAPTLGDKLKFTRYLNQTLAEHWDTIDGYRIEKYLMLVRCIHQEIFHVITNSDHTLEIIEKFMNVVAEEILTGNNIPVGMALQLADIHLEEMYRCFKEFDAFKLKQPEIEAMLEPFLECMKFTTNPQIFNRIKTKIFDRMIEHNLKEDPHTEQDYHFACFDIVPYAEEHLYKAASDQATREINRPQLYKLYEKAAGIEQEKEPEQSYADRINEIRRRLAPKTKHSRKVLQW